MGFFRDLFNDIGLGAVVDVFDSTGISQAVSDIGDALAETSIDNILMSFTPFGAAYNVFEGVVEKQPMTLLGGLAQYGSQAFDAYNAFGGDGTFSFDPFNSGSNWNPFSGTDTNSINAEPSTQTPTTSPADALATSTSLDPSAATALDNVTPKSFDFSGDMAKNNNSLASMYTPPGELAIATQDVGAGMTDNPMGLTKTGTFGGELTTGQSPSFDVNNVSGNQSYDFSPQSTQSFDVNNMTNTGSGTPFPTSSGVASPASNTWNTLKTGATNMGNSMWEGVKKDPWGAAGKLGQLGMGAFDTFSRLKQQKGLQDLMKTQGQRDDRYAQQMQDQYEEQRANRAPSLARYQQGLSDPTSLPGYSDALRSAQQGAERQATNIGRRGNTMQTAIAARTAMQPFQQTSLNSLATAAGLPGSNVPYNPSGAGQNSLAYQNAINGTDPYGPVGRSLAHLFPSNQQQLDPRLLAMLQAGYGGR